MFGSILIGHLLALCTKVFFQERVYDKFLANRMTSELPGELIRPACLGVRITLALRVFGIISLNLQNFSEMRYSNIFRHYVPHCGHQ